MRDRARRHGEAGAAAGLAASELLPDETHQRPNDLAHPIHEPRIDRLDVPERDASPRCTPAVLESDARVSAPR
jgi:hypothetical protein